MSGLYTHFYAETALLQCPSLLDPLNDGNRWKNGLYDFLPMESEYHPASPLYNNEWPTRKHQRSVYTSWSSAFITTDFRCQDNSPNDQFWATELNQEQDLANKCNSVYPFLIDWDAFVDGPMYIDGQAAWAIEVYYNQNLPPSGYILDLCTDWTCHFPHHVCFGRPGPIVKVMGIGLDKHSLRQNWMLSAWMVWDLNKRPYPRKYNGVPVDVVTCTLSIQYLASPQDLLYHVRTKMMRPGATIHLIVSNVEEEKYQPKVINVWRKARQRDLPGLPRIAVDYLWLSGFRDLEIVDLT